MRYPWLGCLLFGGLLFAGAPDAGSNVNSRYKVETVIVSGDGWSTDFASGRDKKISPSLAKRISALIGSQLDPAAIDDLAGRLGKELHAGVSHHVVRGASPSYVRIVYEVHAPDKKFAVAVTKSLYDSKQGWSGAVEGVTTLRQNAFTLGLVSDNDELVDRFAGIRARYEDKRVGTDSVHLQFEFDSYHEQWNGNTADQLPPAVPASAFLEPTSGEYRTRQSFEPSVTVVIAKPLTLTVGASFERFQEQFPAAHTEAANAVISSLRYQGQMEGLETGQDLEAGYDLRAATRSFDSDYVYLRQHWELRYRLTHGRHVVTDEVTAGLIQGRAPLFEQYVLGNSTTLRGWNKFDLDPLGGNRMVHNSVDYRYGPFEMFYDAGAIWDSGQPVIPRHGIGVGLRDGAFALAVAFPIRNGRADPILMMGMNY